MGMDFIESQSVCQKMMYDHRQQTDHRLGGGAVSTRNPSWQPLIRMAGSILLTAVLCSCGTLDGIYQRIEVDSAPRGSEVYLGEGDTPELIGTTPFFYDLRRSSGDQLTFRFGDHAEKKTYKCKFRWLVEGVGNGSIALISWQLSLAAIGIDLITGGAYDCPKTFYIIPADVQKLNTPDVPYCRRFLVVPPKGLSGELADRLSQLWMEQSMRHLRGCDDFLPYASKKYLSFVNAGRGSKPITELDAEKLNFLAFESQATHLAVLAATQSGSDVVIDAEAFDLHRKSPEPMTGFRATAADTPLELSKNPLGPIPVSLDVYPNAMVNGAVLASAGVEARSGYEIEGAPRTLVNATLRRVSFLSVTHPFGFNSWDFTYGVASNVLFFTEDFRWRKEGSGEAADVSITQLAPLYYFDLTALTPVGAFSYKLGAGAYLGAVKSPDRSYEFDLGLITSTKTSYTWFFTKSLFAHASLAYFHVPWRSRIPDEYRLRDQKVQFKVAAGYYFPGWRQ
jgi:hypothetical protein